MCIIRFDWLIALYIFTLLPRNASFLIVKNSCVREEVSDVVFFLQTQLFFTIRKLALRGNKVKRYRAINQSNRIIHMFDLGQTLPKYLRTILNEFEALANLANGPIINTYYAESELSYSTIQYVTNELKRPSEIIDISV